MYPFVGYVRLPVSNCIISPLHHGAQHLSLNLGRCCQINGAFGLPNVFTKIRPVCARGSRAGVHWRGVAEQIVPFSFDAQSRARRCTSRSGGHGWLGIPDKEIIE
eukprot:s1908_g11.t1